MPDFVERMRLHQLAACQDLAFRKLTDVFAGTGVRLSLARVTGVDLERRTVAVTGTPASVEAGRTAQLSGSIVQPQGVGTGTRVVPPRYPMSVHWSGSSRLAIGSGKHAIDQARGEGKVAILDSQTRTLTALRSGSVTVSVTTDSMRAHTDDSSLAPITTSKTIEILPAASE